MMVRLTCWIADLDKVDIKRSNSTISIKVNRDKTKLLISEEGTHNKQTDSIFMENLLAEVHICTSVFLIMLA